MKSDFFEFFPLESDELKKVWAKGTFSFDANILLNLYRYSKQASTEFQGLLKAIRDRVWLTHQAAFEFNRNRQRVIVAQSRSYDEIIKLADASATQLAKEFEKHKRHSVLELELDKIKKIYEKTLKEVKAHIDGLKKNHPQLALKDSILEFVVDLFKDKIGKAYTRQDLELIFSEGEKRYAHREPPGYKDAPEKRGEPRISLFGDLVLWKQLIDYAKERKTPVIFVTDDSKEDWWEQISGKSEPRKELLREFFDESSQRIYIYKADGFMKHAIKFGIVKSIKQASISEVTERRLESEKSDMGTFVPNIELLKTWYDLHDSEIKSTAKIMRDLLIHDFWSASGSLGGTRTFQPDQLVTLPPTGSFLPAPFGDDSIGQLPSEEKLPSESDPPASSEPKQASNSKKEPDTSSDAKGPDPS